MNCNEARQFLAADVDGELDLVRHLELANHLRACPGCGRDAEALRAQCAALRETLPRFRAPAHLAAKIRAGCASTPAPRARSVRSANGTVPSWRLFLGFAASIACAAVVGFAWGGARARTNGLIDQAITEHVRSLQGAHLLDVASTDQHTVKPWFAGKLDFSPPVVDLASVGFPLTGGRLEYIEGHPAAALVFRRRLHTINLFIWPAGDAPQLRRRAERTGFHLESWSDAGLNFLAVSELAPAELATFAEKFRELRPD